jgi:twitching motility two-component system response regulator PilG
MIAHVSDDATSQPVAGPQRQAPLIVIVDDSALIRKLVGYSLQRAGFRVQDFADGVALLQALRQPNAAIPDLVLLDIGLPKMNGYQVAWALKKQECTAGCAIVIVSRRTGVFDRLKGRLVGAYDWLSKPFTTQELLAVVRSALLDRYSQQSAFPLHPPAATCSPQPAHIQTLGERQG